MFRFPKPPLITTLILIFKAIAKELERSKDEVERRISQEIGETLVKPDKASLLLLQTNHDTSDYFSDYIRTGSFPKSTEATTLADREILMAIGDCESFLTDWRKKGLTLPNLIRHLKNHLTFILYEISDETLVYTVFEVLNNRGLDVSWFDRLKSMLMAVVFEAQTGNSEELIDEIHQLWAEIYRTIGLRLGLSTESLRFAATLQSKVCPNRALNEEDATKLLLERSNGDPAKAIRTTKWIKSVTEAGQMV